MNTITLQSNDKTCFTVDSKILKFSNVLNEMLSLLGEESDHEDDQSPILLEHLNKLQLEKVIAWCTYHYDNPPMDDALDRVSNMHEMSPWDREFVRVDRETLFSLAYAANFLDIKPMMHMLCKVIALQMKGRNVMDMLDMFDYLNEEESAKLKKQ